MSGLYRFDLPSGESVVGEVLTPTGRLGVGQVGALRIDAVHAEMGLSFVNVLESTRERGYALVVTAGNRGARPLSLADARIIEVPFRRHFGGELRP